MALFISNAEAAVDLNFAAIVKPGNAEHEDALGFGDPFQDLRRTVFGMPLQHQAQRIQYFLDCLVELGLRRVLGFYGG